MNKAKAIEIINSKDKNATKGLHKALGFDFEKPFHVERIDDMFTVNRALKAAKAAGFSKWDDKIILLCDDTIMKWREYNVVELSTGGNYTIDPFDGYTEGLTKFSAKKDFEDKRKSGCLVSYLVCQKAEYILPHETDRYRRNKDYEPNTNTRYKFIEFRYSQTARLMRTDNNGETFDYDVYKGINADNYNNYIDKSGYCVDLVRKNLDNRFKEFKANRRKAEYMNTDNKERIKALGLLIAEKHTSLIEEFKNAKTADQVRAFTKKLDSWKGFCGIVTDYERMMKKESERAYNSIEAFESDYNGIIETLNTI